MRPAILNKCREYNNLFEKIDNQSVLDMKH